MSRIAIIRLQRASAFLPWPRATGKPGAPPSPPVARPFVNHPLEKRVWRRARRPASDETRMVGVDVRDVPDRAEQTAERRRLRLATPLRTRGTRTCLLGHVPRKQWVSRQLRPPRTLRYRHPPTLAKDQKKGVKGTITTIVSPQPTLAPAPVAPSPVGTAPHA